MKAQQQNNYLWSFKRELEPREPLKFLQQASEREENFYLDAMEILESSSSVKELESGIEGKVEEYLPDVEEAYMFRRYVNEVRERTRQRMNTFDRIGEIEGFDVDPESPREAAALAVVQEIDKEASEFEAELQHHYEQIADSSDFTYRQNFEDVIEKLAS